MKRNCLFIPCTALLFGIMSLQSCIKEPDIKGTSEVEIPSGAVNYFENTMDFGFDGGSTVMSFKVNLKWDMKIANTQNGVQWLTIDPSRGNSGSNKVTFTAHENPTYEDRNVVVQFYAGDTVRTVRVNQKRLEAITLTADKFEVPTEGGNIDIEVNHSADYEVTIPDNFKSWIHKATNNTRGLLETSKLTFTIDPSDEYEKREGRIYFNSKDEEEVVTIYQAGSSKIVLSQNEYNLSGAEQQFSVDISSNFDFKIEMPDAEWLIEDISSTRGMSSHTLKFKVTQNNDYNSRSAKIKIYDNNSKASEYVVVNQASNGAVITLDTLEYSISCDKQDLDIDVKSNFDYDVDFQGTTWVKERSNKTRGITSRLLKLSVDENTGFETRTAKIKLYDKNSSASVEVILNQLANTPTISAEKKEYELDANKQNLDIKVSSNVDYVVDLQGAEWITDRNANTRALSTSTVKLAIAQNDSYDSRTAKIRLYEKDGTAADTITITQKAKNGLEIPTKEFTIDENGGTINIDVNSNIDYKFTINDDCKDWIKEPSKTRGLTSHTHKVEISALGNNEDRTGTITVSNEELKLSQTITIKQRHFLYFDKPEVTVLVGKQNTLSIKNLTSPTQMIGWSSSDDKIATVKDGVVTGVSKGNVTITAKTADGKHTATCKVTVCEIADVINAYCSGGVFMIVNNLVQYGSKMNWTFSNGSTENVKLKSLQLIDGETNTKGNEMSVNKDVAAGKSVTYSITIEGAGIHLPVTCRFKFEFDGKEYTKDAVYEQK